MIYGRIRDQLATENCHSEWSYCSDYDTFAQIGVLKKWYNLPERKEKGQKVGLWYLHFESEELKQSLRRCTQNSWRKIRKAWAMESNSCFAKISVCFYSKSVLRRLRWPPSMDAAAAAMSLQSCLTLCDPIDGSPPSSPVPGILQARTLAWVAISFSNAWKWKLKVKPLSRVRLLATPWTAAHQAPPSMGFARQEYWSGVPLPSPNGC